MRFDRGMSTNFLVPSKFNELNRAKSNEFHAQINCAKSVMAQERVSGHLVEAQNLPIMFSGFTDSFQPTDWWEGRRLDPCFIAQSNDE